MEQDIGFVYEPTALFMSIRSWVSRFSIGKLGAVQCGKIKNECEKRCLPSWQDGRQVANGCEGLEMEELRRGPENSARAG